jgi:hypothetical protein
MRTADPPAARPRIAIVGTFQVGKSTLMNCLLTCSVADMGEGLPTTHAVATYRFAADGVEDAHLYPGGLEMEMADYWGAHARAQAENRPLIKNLERVEFDLNRPSLRAIDVLDTPGLDAPGEHGRVDKERTEGAMAKADFVLFVVPNRDITEMERSLIRQIAVTNKPYAMLMNCFDPNGWEPGNARNEHYAATVAAQLPQMGATPIAPTKSSPVWACNAAWYWVAEMAELPAEQLSPRHRERLDELRDRVGHHFRKQRRGIPEPEELKRLSSFLPVQEFLCGTGLQARTASAIVRLNNAAQEWRQDLSKGLQEAMDVAAQQPESS